MTAKGGGGGGDEGIGDMSIATFECEWRLSPGNCTAQERQS